MSIPLPPASGIIFPPLPPYPPPPPWSPPPAPSHKPVGGVIAGISIAIGVLLFLLSCICSLIRGHRQSRTDAAAADTSSPTLRPRTAAPDHSEQQLSGGAPEDDEPRRASNPTADLPSFTYNQSAKHNVTGAGEEAATCSVCLAAFQTGETVRLLPVCLHLFHVECIDPWLDAHSSCPICRTGTEPAVDGGQLPPV